MKKTKHLGRLFISLVMVAFFVAMTSSPGQAQAVRVRMGGGPMGTAIHSMCAAWAEVMNKHLRDRVEISVQVTPGTRQNPIMIRDGLLDLAGASSSGDLPAWKGEDLAKGKPCQNIRLMFAYSKTTYISFAPEGTGIKSFEDFAGKKIGLGAKGSPTSKTSEEFFKTAGIEARFFYMSPSEMIERLKDGLLDGSMYGVSHPWPPLVDLTSTTKVRFLIYKEKYIEDFLRKNPTYVAESLPANIYPNQPFEINTFGSIMALNAAASVSEELVYLLVKTTWAHVDEIRKAAPYANALDHETTMKYITPLHPGGVRYYQEKGVKIPPKLSPPK
ncbi:MAG: TAXI family TRAP transporter solute-binding subunit [Deltaproteobacteria bacterium]|nr:TAXI family TRAP transporter solute-binding subunit [Deltaproteobacteria bacterium]